MHIFPKFNHFFNFKKSWNLILFILYGWVFCVYICHIIACVPGALRDQKMLLDALELEFSVVVSYNVAAEN